jgi:RNA polymerase sigma-70 factor (ECF subfamily)
VRETPSPDHAEMLANLAALLLGGLAPDEEAVVRAHVDSCEICTTAEPELIEAAAKLADLPPEILIDGPPEDAEGLVRRTLQRLRSAED